jgi:lipopolysaccharide transport system ATP-binding protein
MNQTIIKVEGVSKQYRLGQISTGSIAHDVNRWWYKLRRKEDPYLKIGEENKRTEKGNSEYVWALRDISFEVKQGDVLGIIGRNGAGKSTLLKILSRTTLPTQGSIKAKGRIASLLEVGTGFHPELTGRENIFLNGAILGMTKREIASKFDEIVSFSGVEKYIDTPVKRYSSGMYVRLAFAVAAHLEPEILIVDEVLAVGDAEFQKKCLGKMKDVSVKEGRTVLFVSHNMTAITSLCSRAVYLKNGRIFEVGSTDLVVNNYFKNENSITIERIYDDGKFGDDVSKLISARLIDENLNSLDRVTIDRNIGIEFVYEVFKSGYRPIPNIHVMTSKNEIAFVTVENYKDEFLSLGIFKSTVWIPKNLLNEETYIVGIALSTMSPVKIHFYDQEALIFDVIEDVTSRKNDYNQKMPGVLRPNLKWETIQISKL